MKKINIKESELKEIVRNSIIGMLKEAFSNDDIEIEDDWNKEDEFDVPEEPVDISDDDIVLEPEEKPENLSKAEERRRRAAELIRNILAKQGYKGDKLDAEVAKRMGNEKPDANTRRMDRMYSAADDPITVDGKQIGYMQSGGIYDDDFDLNECVKKIVRKVLSS